MKSRNKTAEEVECVAEHHGCDGIKLVEGGSRIAFQRGQQGKSERIEGPSSESKHIINPNDGQS